MTVVAGAPTRADGLELIGEMKGSGYKEPPALVRRSDGQTVQLTPLLYAVLAEIRDGRTSEEVARHVSERLGRTVTADNVETLVDGQLRPLGLLKRPDGSDPALKRSNPLLGLRFKFAVTSEHLTRRLTAPFTPLFTPALVAAVTIGFVLVAWWVLMRKGLGSATYQAFAHPGLLMVIVAVMLLSAGFHEFGHAAAARRGGATPGTMGGGLYLVWPAFYTDVTDSYRLGRVGRLRTDLGGLYFDAIVAVGVFGVWWATGWDGWLLVVAAQLIGMSKQLTPLVRFDGYHILCDVTGVPDLFGRIKPVLLSFLPRYRHSTQVSALKGWVRVVVSVWVLAVVPILAIGLLGVVFSLPRVAGTAWTHAQAHAEVLGRAVSAGEITDAGSRVVAIIATVFPVLAMVLMIGRLGWAMGKKAWIGSRGNPRRRAVVSVVGLLVIAVLTAIWWPRPGTYRPVQPWERGTLADAVPTGVRGVGDRLVVGSMRQASMAFPKGTSLPTRAHPQLSMVLVPRHTHGSSGSVQAVSDTRAAPTPTAAAEHPWIFPFNRPLAPGEGDNQAMAVNYTDGGTTYDVAFAMVWADDGADVRNRNEAYALASCQACTTVAVAFQVVFVVGQSDMVVPQNVAAAVNYNCQSCVTVALAQQLALTVTRTPDADVMAKIQALWADLTTWSGHLENLSFSEIAAKLDGFEVQVITLLKDAGVLVVPSPSPAPVVATPSASTPSDLPSGSASPSAGATDTGSADASGSDGTGGTDGTGTGSTGTSGTSGSTGSTSSPSDPTPTGASSPDSSSVQSTPAPSAAATP